MDINKLQKEWKEKEEYEIYVFKQLEKHRAIADRELSNKGKFSKGYYDTMKKLGGPLGSGPVLPLQERKDVVRWAFTKKSKDPYTQGEIKAITDYKKHQNKAGLNIYGQKIKRK